MRLGPSAGSHCFDYALKPRYPFVKVEIGAVSSVGVRCLISGDPCSVSSVWCLVTGT